MRALFSVRIAEVGDQKCRHHKLPITSYYGDLMSDLRCGLFLIESGGCASHAVCLRFVRVALTRAEGRKVFPQSRNAVLVNTVGIGFY